MKDYYTFSQAKVHAENETVTVRTDDGGLRRLPVEQVSGLHLLAGYSITDGLVHLANKARFSIHFYSYGGHYQGSLDPRPAAPQAALLMAQLDSIRDPENRISVARAIAVDHRRCLTELLSSCNVESDLPAVGGSSVEELLLSEARMRKEYYAHVDTCLEPYWSVLRRERQPPRRPADAVMGFANGIVYAKMAGWIHRVGLDPRLGYIHGATRAPNPLALDLADLVKPHLSDAVLIKISQSGKAASLIQAVEEGVYLNEAGRKAVIQAIEERLERTLKGIEEIWATDYRTAFMQIPLSLHRTIASGRPLKLPRIPCTLS